MKEHKRFHSVNGKRRILLVDDEAISRMILANMLSEDYEVIQAGDGEEGLRIIRERSGTLSLVLLDLNMPRMHGFEVLDILKSEPELREIPVIVLTAETESEVESLHHGAVDFIPKPYTPEVVLARAGRTIELSEDRKVIHATERDELTGLYNREFFYTYAVEYDKYHEDTEMDAIVIDVNNFRMINERFGKAYGDGVLRRIGEKVREVVRDSGGIVCRREADTFLVYCPRGKDYQAIMENAMAGLAGEEAGAGSNRIRLRMGVYTDVDKSLDIERRFDRAKIAADTIRNNYAKNIAFYDRAMHEKELFTDRLLENIDRALEEKQFQVCYQPKFNVKGEKPVLASAEALVRWHHPEFGKVSPGIFIPLFEENGLISRLDEYVWREAAAQVRRWKERFGVTIPVSVNVSRVDMFDPKLVETIRTITEENGLKPEEYLLEITESAYTEDSDQIVRSVKELRALGFRVEMDDFGSGYSSLNMLSSLPIDALKLDMRFVQGNDRERKDTKMLTLMIDIAQNLEVPVIAEGVETEEQMKLLKGLGCDLIQGYYFSKPLSAADFERFIQERGNQ